MEPGGSFQCISSLATPQQAFAAESETGIFAIPGLFGNKIDRSLQVVSLEDLQIGKATSLLEMSNLMGAVMLNRRH